MNKKITAARDKRLYDLIVAATTGQAPGGIDAILSAARTLASMGTNRGHGLISLDETGTKSVG